MNNEEQWLLKEKYGGEKSEGFFADLERLKAGEPLAYVIGSIPFLGTTIYLDSHPLIPRPETEYWVEKAIADIKGAGAKHPRILDLCAGSGCIGVAVAKALPESHITFGELSKAHLPTIALNLQENDIDCTRYQVFQSDLFENISGTFDYILSNPPYIDPALDRTEPSVSNFEPSEALYGGKAGLELIEKILTAASAHLNPNGVLYIEHEPEQVEEIATLAKAHGLVATTHHDQYEVSRYTTFTAV